MNTAKQHSLSMPHSINLAPFSPLGNTHARGRIWNCVADYARNKMADLGGLFAHYLEIIAPA